MDAQRSARGDSEAQTAAELDGFSLPGWIYRDPDFLGIVNLDNDMLYIPLKKGHNELVLAVSEIGGGWGFICRLEEVAQN